ncbi:hypothetical protein [Fusobacterium sp.]|uniref:hypothetical protein n=1 Tax=Fusobacterium sp. TaxID=68766 RepID=UPI0029042DE6|nr:hypothetical protein [Fusobacterium sp.]MDU1909719.1 hypothetical protein [Fusobacterium sp.]
MIDPGTALELVKTGAGTLSQYIVSDPVTAIANLCTITGYSLRDLKGLLNFNKWGKKFEEKFPNGLETEVQETILSDCFIELEDYIKNSSNLDDNVFEKIGDLLIHGLENEDLLTREYIRILKQLTWIELQIFLELYNASYEKKTTSKGMILSLMDHHTEETINYLIKKLNYPIELIQEIMDKLFDINLFKERGMGAQGETNYPLIRNQYGTLKPKSGTYIIKYYMYSSLGEAIYNLLKKEF